MLSNLVSLLSRCRCSPYRFALNSRAVYCCGGISGGVLSSDCCWYCPSCCHWYIVRFVDSRAERKENRFRGAMPNACPTHNDAARR